MCPLCQFACTYYGEYSTSGLTISSHNTDFNLKASEPIIYNFCENIWLLKKKRQNLIIHTLPKNPLIVNKLQYYKTRGRKEDTEKTTGRTGHMTGWKKYLYQVWQPIRTVVGILWIVRVTLICGDKLYALFKLIA